MGNVVVPTLGGLVLTGAILVALLPPQDFYRAQEPLDPKDETRTTGAVEPAELLVAAPPDRDVTPAGVTSLPSREGPLRRIAPARTLPVTEVDPRDETVYRRILVVEAGAFRTVIDNKPLVIRIAGVRAPAFGETCGPPEGPRWKCGARARAELARLIGSKSIACRLADDSNPLEILADCRVGQRSIGRWLVENGWADPQEGADPELAGLAIKARETRRGRHKPTPEGVF